MRLFATMSAHRHRKVERVAVACGSVKADRRYRCEGRFRQVARVVDKRALQPRSLLFAPDGARDAHRRICLRAEGAVRQQRGRS